ncbi:hypothetical protein BS50DRAFT_588165 [Corynespora cassiicola Philippines]|uniref:Heterokaryon incompatibility domain-containing protein n=1 Tax=Corynespora cassiicola Philippines TaxID=1448308 RepID=A0A2T2NP27_CORCC|nr:hypothetical protein BS50DRAFT_588165 [Corynespora cassiicola Philippines]
MEHIPSIQGSFPLNVPLLDLSPTYGEQPRGFHGFREFPALSGHDIDELGSQGSDTMATLGMLQSWLFFGLLTEAFGGKPSHLKHAEFVTTCDGGEKKITTRALQKYFFYWRARRWHGKRAEVTRHANEVDQCLALASSVIEKFAVQHDYLRNDGLFCGSQVDLILLSIATVGEWVSKARRDTVQFTEANTQNFRPLGWHLPFLNKALEQSGWCIGERKMLMRECNTTCLYYLSTIERSGLGKDHTGCDESGCTALQMRYSEYQPLHVCLHHNRTHCLRQGPRIRQVADILDRGSVPLIRVSSDGKCNLLALDNDDDLEYVAISHVWSDGMGNPKENKLNMCTLQHIQHLVNNLFDPERRPIPFWIDTMCIPPQEHHFTKHKESRKQGIAQMAQIYANASKVLVLDRWLQQVSSKVSLTEIAVRIRHAPWTTRIWMLQEGRLSESLYFQFKDGVVSSAYLDDFVRDQRNLVHVSNLMDSMSNTEVLSNECATWILRAFAYLYEIDPMIKHYGQLGPQQDEAEEELRLHALSILTERAELEPIWNRWGVLIENHGLNKDLGDADEHVHTDIRVQRVDLVSEYGANIMSKIKGQGYQHIVRSGNGLNQDQYPSASLLFDVVRSFKDRTTSRKEDEVICLGILLRIKNMSAVTDIEPLSWRWRVALKATISSHIQCVARRYG